MELIQTLAGLEAYLKEKKKFHDPLPKVAVEALIFNREGKLALLLRGPGAPDEHYKLEGVGGGLILRDGGDLQVALNRKIEEEIGAAPADSVRVKVKIDKLLEVRIVKFLRSSTKELITWVVVSHLCRLEEGTPFNRKPDEHIEIRYLSLDELFVWQTAPTFIPNGDLDVPGLSESLVIGREVYKEQYGNRSYYAAG